MRGIRYQKSTPARMNGLTYTYQVPDGTPLHDIKDHLGSHFRVHAERPRHLYRIFYDDFDWHLYHAGVCLEENHQGRQRQLRWQDLRGETPDLEQPVTSSPGFARDLPPGLLKKHLESVIGVRRLLPRVKVDTCLETWRLLNSDDKTVARLVLEEHHYQDPQGGRQGALAARLRLFPVKGYDRERKVAIKVLRNDVGLDPAPTPLLLEALGAAGLQPGSYSSKPDYHLDPAARIDQNCKTILLDLLNTIEANVDGTLSHLDPEFLHDLRVATRRSRSALTQIKGVFPPKIVDEFSDHFKWLQQITGPVRDLDVYLLDFEYYRDSLAPPLQPHLEPMREYLEDHYGQAHRIMVQHLHSARFDKLLRDWRSFLEAPVPEHPALPNAMRRTREVADERIWKIYRRVVKEGRAITPDSPPEVMHELRKSCKKLRYLMEFFASLHPQKEFRPLIKLLKSLLDNLGQFQDLAVQADKLTEMAVSMREEKRAPTETLLAMGALVGHQLELQQKARQQFTEIFVTFDSKANRKRFRKLFAPGRKGESKA